MTGPQPELRTPRLLLRPFQDDDTDAVHILAGERLVSRDTLNIPHPYSEAEAGEWIAGLAGQYERGVAATFAACRQADGALVGAVGLILDHTHGHAELGYWIGRPYWSLGYASEAAGAVVGWGFHHFALHRIHAAHFPANEASGRVLRKIGMGYEGQLREHVCKDGEYLDLECYGILRADWALVQSHAGY